MPSASATAVSIESARRLRTLAAHDEAVDHDRDVVLVLLVELDLLVEHPQLAVDLDAREALGAQLLEQLAVLALAAADDRREDHEARRPRRSSMTWSMICSADWPAIGAPQTWQCGWPTRAHSRRR